MFVGVVGLGPFAGILAIAVSDTGSFGKLFSEAIEANPARERETSSPAAATGGWVSASGCCRKSAGHRRPGALLFRVEHAIRDDHRYVGAGGIGLQLSEQIRTYDFDQVAFIVGLILIAVAAIDWISGKLRFAIIGRRQVLA